MALADQLSRITAWLLFALLIPSPHASAQESWVGESVLYRKPADEIKFGDVLQGRQVYFPFSGGWPIKVRDDREGWLRIHDGNREGWVDKADFMLVRDAPAYFHRRVQANPNDIWALSMRGLGWFLKGELDIAIKDFDQCIRLDPTNAWAFNSRGTAWSEKKEWDKAIRDYGEVIRLDPKDGLAFYNRGNAWRGKKELDKAIRDFDESIRLNPKHADSFNNRGISWSDKKMYDKALRDFDEAIRIDPKYANPFHSKACAYALQGNTSAAIENLRKSIELGYTDFDQMAIDSDLDSIRSDPRYKELQKKYAK